MKRWYACAVVIAVEADSADEAYDDLAEAIDPDLNAPYMSSPFIVSADQLGDPDFSVGAIEHGRHSLVPAGDDGLAGAYRSALARLEAEGGPSAAPGSPHGTDASQWRPVAALLAVIVQDATEGLMPGEGVENTTLDHAAGLVVNGHDEVVSMIMEHGGQVLAALDRQLVDFLDEDMIAEHTK